MLSKDYLEWIYQQDETFKSLGRLSGGSALQAGIAQAQARAAEAAQRHKLEDLQLYQQQQMAQSKALLQNAEPPPYVIGATSRDQGSSTMVTSSEAFREFNSFHAQMERERGESKPKVDFRYRVAQLLLLGLVLQLIMEIIK